MSIAIPFFLASAFFGGWYFWRRLRSRPANAAQKLFVILHDGRTTSLYPATRSATSGNLVVDRAEYPPSLAQRLEDYSSLRASFYLVAVEPVELEKHRSMELARQSIALSDLFKSGGEMMEMLRIAGACAVLAAAVFVYFQVGSVGDKLSRQQVALDQVVEILSKPLIVGGPAIQPPSIIEETGE